MQLRGFDSRYCPLIGEIRYYENRDNTVTEEMMEALNETFHDWLQLKNSELPFNEAGYLNHNVPPVTYNIS